MPTTVDKSWPSAVDKSYSRDRFSITPSDTVQIRAPADGIYVGVGGDLTIKNKRGETVKFESVPSGQTVLVGGATFVMATGTAASDLVGIVDKGLR